MHGSQKCCGELAELTADDIWKIADAGNQELRRHDCLIEAAAHSGFSFSGATDKFSHLLTCVIRNNFLLYRVWLTFNETTVQYSIFDPPISPFDKISLRSEREVVQFS